MKDIFIYWRGFGVSVLALAACGVSASTASAASTVSMPLGGHAMPPVGFTAFCARKPDQCLGADITAPSAAPAAVPVEDQALVAGGGMATGWALAFLRVRGERDIATGALDASGSTRAFHAVSRWNVDLAPGESTYRSWGARGGAERGAADARVTTEVESTARLTSSPNDIEHGQASLKLLKRVNREINRAIVPATDEQISGSWDRWDEPVADLGGAKGTAYGDCEDYVLEKRRVLIAQGVDPKTLSIAVVRSHGGDIHAVLIAATENGEYVLDNLSYWVLPWQEAPYTWVMRQVDGDAREWRAIQRLGAPVRTAALSLQ